MGSIEKNMAKKQRSFGAASRDGVNAVPQKRLIQLAKDKTMNRANTYIFVAVKRVDDELHHSIDFRLKMMFFCLLPQFSNLSNIQPI